MSTFLKFFSNLLYKNNNVKKKIIKKEDVG